MDFVDMGLPFTFGGILLLFALIWFRQKTQAWRQVFRLLITVVMIIFIAIFLITGSVLYWYTHRPIPSSIQQDIFTGVTYNRDVRSEPRPIIIHVISIDLTAANVRFAVTDGDSGAERTLRAQKTSDFLAEHDLQIAINGDFYEPWWNNGPWDYYPHSDDSVDVFGLASSEGNIYEIGHGEYRTLYMSADHVPSFDPPQDGQIYNAISGNVIFVSEGESVVFNGDYRDRPHPRTAVALNQDSTRLILIVVDGRQPNYSEGVTLEELADIVIEYGGYTALNLDGGGSSTLVIEDEDGKPDVLNSPIDNHIPGLERPVGNHLGIYIDE